MPDDDLIDRAAHALTRGEPSPQLRHAVRARIDAGRPGLESGGTGLAKQARRVWIPVAAAAAIVLSVILAQNTSRPRVELPGSTQIASAPPVALPAAPPPTAVRQIEKPVRVNAPKRTPERRLVVVDPLVIEPISVPLIAVDSGSAVMPMDIQPLQIEPLQPQ